MLGLAVPSVKQNEFSPWQDNSQQTVHGALKNNIFLPFLYVIINPTATVESCSAMKHISFFKLVQQLSVQSAENDF